MGFVENYLVSYALFFFFLGEWRGNNKLVQGGGEGGNGNPSGGKIHLLRIYGVKFFFEGARGMKKPMIRISLFLYLSCPLDLASRGENLGATPHLQGTHKRLSKNKQIYRQLPLPAFYNLLAKASN